MIGLLIFLVLLVLLIFLYFKYFKLIKMKNILFVDGSLGTGKSFLSVALSIRLYKKNLRRYKLKMFLLKRIFNFGKFKDKWKKLEKPLLYSNIKLRHIDFVILNKDLLFRQNYRFAYGSVLLIDEFSLVADQMTYKDNELNERLSEFFKLFRHESRGGYIIINSQSTSDLHYSLKYVLSDYLYIHSRSRFPLFSALKVEEVTYSADRNSSGITTVNNGDVDENLKIMLVRNKYFKYYDTYSYSIFTDCLPVYNCLQYFDKNDSLKSDCLVSFKAYRFLYQNLEKEKEKNEVLEKERIEKDEKEQCI